jgi:hypothetical protein
MTHRSPSIRFEIAKLNLRPGDVLVIRTMEHYSKEAMGHLVDNFKNLVPNGVKGIVLDSGIDLTVIHPEDGDGI